MKKSLTPDIESTLKTVPIIPMSPEAFDLPSEMSEMAQYVTRDSGGGLGDFFGGFVRGLFKRKISQYPTTPNYKRMFKKFSGLDEEQYVNKVHSTPTENVILISSPRFSETDRVYYNDNDKNAVHASDFQDQAPGQIKAIRRNHNGKAIVITSDQFVGGVTNAYCKKRGIPNIHIAHNLLNVFIPFEYFKYADLSEKESGYGELVYKTFHQDYPGRVVIEGHTTAVQNADIVVIPGKQFSKELIGEKQADGHYAGRFDNKEEWPQFKDAHNLIEEIKIKADKGQVRCVPNGISEAQLPEFQTYLPQMFGPKTKDIIKAKMANEFFIDDIVKYYFGIDPIDMFATCRPNDSQKGYSTIVKSAVNILHTNPDTRLILMGDDITPNKQFENMIKHEQSYLTPGRLIHLPHNTQRSNQLYAKGAIFLAAHSYEPFGYGFAQAIACGAIPVTPYNGGAVDMVKLFSPENNSGNGLFHNNTIGDMTFQLQNAVNITRELRKNPELANKNYKRMMKEIRNEFSLDNMINGYLEICNELGRNSDLFKDGYKPYKLK